MDKRFVLNSVQLGISGLPLILSITSLFLRTYVLDIFAAVLIPVVACFFPLFRRRANLWTFVFVALVSLPVNIRIITKLKILDIFLYDSVFMNILQGILAFCILFSIEQIFLGVIVAMIRSLGARLYHASDTSTTKRGNEL